jgi:hypothetical protein
VACGPLDTTPTPEELIQQQAFAAKGGGKEEPAPLPEAPGSDNGNHYGWYKQWDDDSSNRCSARMEDPFADEMPEKRLAEGFEDLVPGPMPDRYAWHSIPGSTSEVTSEQAFEGVQSLKVTAPATGGYHYVGPRFCVRCEAKDHFKTSFAIRFESFVSWTGLMVTNNPEYAYWWWVRSDGTVFDDQTFAQLQVGTWHLVEIDINRKSGIGTITIDGVDHAMPLTAWYPAAASQPMGCYRLLLLSKAAQTVYLDRVKVHAIK